MPPKLLLFRSEVEELQAKVGKERERYQDSTLNSNFMELSAISLIPVHSTVSDIVPNVFNY